MMSTNALTAGNSLQEMSNQEMQTLNGGQNYTQARLNELIKIHNYFATQANSMGAFMWNYYKQEVNNYRKGLEAQNSQ